MKLIETNAAPLPAGHYSQAVVAGGLIFVAGLLPIIPNTNREIPDGLVAQTEQVFNNLRAILAAAGVGLDALASVQIFVPSIESWSELNSVYVRELGTHKPARTVIPCGPLHYGVLLEMNAVAVAAG